MENLILVMKKFSENVKEYGRHDADSSTVEVQNILQILASMPDVGAFDQSSETTTNFFISLHHLLSGLDSTSMLVSSAVAALQTACKSKQAKNMLIHTFKFIPVLARFLTTNHITDKQMRLLQLLSSLTYGVKITWQEAHIPQLVSTLAQIIMGNNKDQKAEALCVLVNLCYKNLPVLYVLMRHVQVKRLLKYVLAMNDDPGTSMLVCKLLFIVSEVKGPLPDEDILRFIDGAFNCVTVAFEKGDVRTLRHATDFFVDVCENGHILGVFSRYPKLMEETKRLLGLIANAGESGDDGIEEIIIVLLDFLPAIFRIKNGKIWKLIPNCVTLSAPWLHRNKTAAAASKVLTMAIDAASNDDDKQDITSALSSVLDQLCAQLGAAESLITGDEAAVSRFSEIITLVGSMAENAELRRKILALVDPVTIQSLFSTVYSARLPRCRKQDQTAVLLLFLVTTLSTHSDDWMALYLELIGKKQVLNSISVSMLTGDKAFKYKVLRLVGSIGWGKESLSALCEILAQHTSQIRGIDEKTTNSEHTDFTDCLPHLPLATDSRIDELLARLNGVDARDASTSAIMELYEFKLASMGHVERQTQAALEASDSRCVALNHQVAQLNAQVEKLHKLLLYQQQTLDGSTSERRDLLQQIEKLSHQNAEEKSCFDRKSKEFSIRLQEMEMHLTERNSQLNKKHETIEGLERLLQQNLAESTAQLNIKQETIEELERNLQHVQTQLATKTCENEDMSKKYGELTRKYEESTKALAAAEEKQRISENHISEYEAQMGDLQAEHEEVKSSLSQCMDRLNVKDEQIEELNKQVRYLEQIREAVISVANANIKDKF